VKKELIGIVAVALLVLTLSAVATAACTNVTSSVLPIGRDGGGYIILNPQQDPNGMDVQTISVPVTQGHSYSISIVQYYTSPNPAPSMAISSDANCAVAMPQCSSGGVDSCYVITTNMDPAFTWGSRIAFIAPTTGTVNFTFTNNDTANSVEVDLAATETTQINPRWSTNGCLTTWSFANTTNTDIQGRLTLFFPPHAPIATTFTVAAGSTTTKDTSLLGVPVNSAGYALFAPLAPAGGVISDGFFLVPGLSIVPVVFQPVSRGL
jgi:hypothetical protein